MMISAETLQMTESEHEARLAAMKARAEAAEKRVAQWEHDIKFWGIAEIAVRNVSVMDCMKHWEGRAEAAEKECDRLREELTKIARMANMNHDGNHLQKIARTALEKIANEKVIDEPFPNENRILHRDDLIKIARAALEAKP